MMRVLLLCQSDCDFQTQRVVESLRAMPGLETEVVSVGRGGAMLAAWRVLRAKADLVHAFGSQGLRLASFSRKPVLFTPSPLAVAGDARWLRAAEGWACCLSAEDHRTLVQRGVAADACELVRPGVRPHRPAGDRAAVREKLGLGEKSRAILVVDEPGRWGNAALGAQAVSMLNALDGDYRLLLWGQGSAQERLLGMTRKWSRGMACEVRTVLPEADFAEVAWLADLAVVATQQAFPLMPVLACMSAGTPLVGTATRAVSELLEDHHTALLAEAKPKRLAQRLLMLAEDQGLGRKLADAASAEAYELFSVSRFQEQMRRVYERVAGAAGPAVPQTPGMRDGA